MTEKYGQPRSGHDRRAEPPECASHCEDHSGRITWERGITALLVFCAGMLSYSVMWQAPNIRFEVAAQITELRMKEQETINKLNTLEKRTDNVDARLCILEGK